MFGRFGFDFTLFFDLSLNLFQTVGAYRLLLTKNMSLLCLTFFYSGINYIYIRNNHLIKNQLFGYFYKIGLELSFFSGVYGTAIGNTNNLVTDGNAKPFIGICGMLIGLGEIIGGATFGLLGSKTNRFGRDPIVILGYVVHMISFFLIFINLPSVASLERTNDPSYIDSRSGMSARRLISNLIFIYFLIVWESLCSVVFYWV